MPNAPSTGKAEPSPADSPALAPRSQPTFAQSLATLELQHITTNRVLNMAQPSTKSIKVNRLGLIVPHYDYCYIIVITGIVTVFKVMVILKNIMTNQMTCNVVRVFVVVGFSWS